MKYKIIIPIFLMIFLIIGIIPQTFGGTWTGDFEIHNFSRWDSNTGWGISSEIVHSGLYSAKCISSGSSKRITKSFPVNSSDASIEFWLYISVMDFDGGSYLPSLFAPNDIHYSSTRYLGRIAIYEVAPEKWVYQGKDSDPPTYDWQTWTGVEVVTDEWLCINVTIDTNGFGNEAFLTFRINGDIMGSCPEGTVYNWESFDNFFMDGQLISGGEFIMYIDDIAVIAEGIEDDKYEYQERGDPFDWWWLKWVLLIIIIVSIISFTIYSKYGDDYNGF